MAKDCPKCGYSPAPPEPPMGTWVKDRHGATHVRIVDVDGFVGWAASPHGFYAGGNWEAMWDARGPLTICGAWGRDA